MRFSSVVSLTAWLPEGVSPVFPRIGHADASQDTGFFHFHAARVAHVVMVVAAEVQCAMDHQVSQMVRNGASRSARLAAHGAQGQHDVPAEEAGRGARVQCRT